MKYVIVFPGTPGTNAATQTEEWPEDKDAIAHVAVLFPATSTSWVLLEVVPDGGLRLVTMQQWTPEQGTGDE